MFEEKFGICEENSLNFQNSFDIPETELIADKEGNEV